MPRPLNRFWPCDMANRGLEIGDVVLEGLAADSQLSVVQAGDSIAQSSEPGR